MSKTAICTGSFDPITLGHEDIIRKASRFFDTVYVCVLINAEKKAAFSLEERAEMCSKIFSDVKNIKVIFSDKSAVEVFKMLKADVIVRGIRDTQDIEYEICMSNYNKSIDPSVQTVFIACDESLKDISSSMVKRYVHEGKKLDGLINCKIKKTIINRLS